MSHDYDKIVTIATVSSIWNPAAENKLATVETSSASWCPCSTLAGAVDCVFCLILVSRQIEGLKVGLLQQKRRQSFPLSCFVKDTLDTANEQQLVIGNLRICDLSWS
uniref:Uncharacterized protein n=1 Tax=Opuntia streptacantha TaxID=393608 RepID=A0A7C9EMM2_OPUST